MIADIVTVWPGRTRTMVLAKDRADGITKSLYVDLREDIGQWIASACKTAKGPIVLTINPPNQWGCEIVDAEKFPGEREAS